MARPQVSKTPLGQRLSDIRKALGFESRKAFAAILEMHPDTLGGYERGQNEPDSEYMAMYHRRFGVNVSWLVSGEGNMFVDPAKASPSSRTVDKAIMHRLGRLVATVHKAEGVKLPPEAIVAEAADLYNELVKRVTDWTDADEIEAVMPQLERLLVRKLQSAAAEPGTGKRSA